MLWKAKCDEECTHIKVVQKIIIHGVAEQDCSAQETMLSASRELSFLALMVLVNCKKGFVKMDRQLCQMLWITTEVVQRNFTSQ